MAPTPIPAPVRDYRAEWAAQEAWQVEVNGLELAEAAVAIRARFDAEHASHPQYAGFLDDAHLVRVVRPISGKGGIRFEAGDLTLALYRAGLGLSVSPEWTAYSGRVGWNVAVRFGDVVLAESGEMFPPS